MIPFDAAVFIGRFQPVHKGHVLTMRQALNSAARLVIVLGGWKRAPSTRMPWNDKQRKQLILSCFSLQERRKIDFVCVRDRLYDDSLWRQNVLQEVTRCVPCAKNIALFGYHKDLTSSYLDDFPNWHLVETDYHQQLNATAFRLSYFLTDHTSYHMVPRCVENWLRKYKKKPAFRILKNDFKAEIKAMKEVNKPTRADYELLICGPYALLTTQKKPPGVGQYALPAHHMGGENGTAIVLKDCTFIGAFAFDHTERHLHNQPPAHVHVYQSPLVPCLNMVCPTKQKEHHWMFLDDLVLYEDCFFLDHYQMIRSLLFRNPCTNLG